MSIADHHLDRLSEYLDGELTVEERDRLEAHLDACSVCMATLVELRRVSETARALPQPALRADLQASMWAGIATRLTPRPRPFAERIAAALRPMGGRFSLSIPQLAAAAAALVVVSAGITYFGAQLAARRDTPPAIVAQRPEAGRSVEDASGPPDASLELATGAEDDPVSERPLGATTRTAVASFDEARYATAVADLERTLDTHRADLDPSTVRALEDNLAVIDEAVVEARRALNADPSNPYLSGHLANQMHRKVRVLQRAAMIVAATR